MKKTILLFMFLFVAFAVNSQIAEKTYTIPASQLTIEQLAEIERANLEKKMEHTAIGLELVEK